MEGPASAVIPGSGGRHGSVREPAMLPPAGVAGIIALALTASAFQSGYVVPVVILAALFLFWSYRRPVVAISVIILGHVALLEKTEDITLPEILFGVYFFGFIAWWLFDRMMLKRERVCEDPADWFLMGYLVFSLFSVVTCIGAGSELISWLREYLTVATLFLYFPLRVEMKTGRKRKFILTMLIVMICAIAVNNIMNYGISVLAAHYFWELLGARQAANAHFFFPACVLLGSFFIHETEAKYRYGYLIPLLTVSLALLLTFARGFWFGSAVGASVIFLISPPRIRRRIFGYGILVIVAAIAVNHLFTGGLGSRVVESLFERFTSTGRSLADISLRGRYVESVALLKPILESPIVGNGYGTEFSFYNILTNSTSTTVYAHNGYLFLLFKVGIIGTLLLLSHIFRVIQVAWRKKNGTGYAARDIALIRGSLGVFAGLLLITVTSNTFIEKESLLVMMVLGAAILSTVGESLVKNRGMS